LYEHDDFLMLSLYFPWY